MDQETLLALIEKNPDSMIIEVDDWCDLSNDPTVVRKREAIMPYLRPECFPPELKHLAPEEYKDEKSLE